MKVKTTILAFYGAFILACLQSAFPHFFTYGLCSILCLGLFSLSIVDMIFRPLFPDTTSRWSRYLNFFTDAFPFLLLFGITTFSVAALNEKLYSPNPEMHSVYKGWFTLGGIVPLSDSGDYFASILSFLDDGSVQYMAQSRPFPHLFAAVLYKLSGTQWMVFFQVSTGLLVVSIWFHGIVVARYVGRLVALISSAILCWYFSLFQATFLTELTGGCVGMVALALLLHGYFVRSIKAYGFGLLLFALAMQMRSGVVFFLPVLIIVGGIRFRMMFRTRYKSFLVCAILMLVAIALPECQNRLLQNPIHRQSNTVIYLLQVMRNSDTWMVFEKEYPYRVINGNQENYNERFQRASIDVQAELLRHPDVFVRNYFSMMVRYSPRIERYLMPWADAIPAFWAWRILLCFLAGFWILPVGSRLRSLSWLLVAYLICCFLGLPMLFEISLRFYAASIAMNTLVASIALYNLIYVVWGLLRRITGRSSAGTTFLTSQPEAGTESRHWMPIFPFVLPILLFVLAVLGPIFIDQFRYPAYASSSHPRKLKGTATSRLASIDMTKSPYALLDPVDDFKVKDPLTIPRGKWLHEWKDAPLPSGRTYWILPYIHLQGKADASAWRYKRVSALLLPEKMLHGVRISDIERLVLKTDSVPHPIKNTLYSGFFEVKEIIDIQLKPNAK